MKARVRAWEEFRRVRMDEWPSLPIGPAACARGASLCLENGRGLFDDAVTLLEAGAGERGVALAILALEEGEKVTRLFNLAVFTDPAEVKREWKKFRNHRPKLSGAFSPLTHGGWTLFHENLPPRRGTKPTWLAEIPRLASQLKERCFYVDRLKDGTWTVPARMMPRPLPQAIVGAVMTFFSLRTTLALGRDLVLGGQLEGISAQLPQLSEMTPRARRWMRWRHGKAGQRWGEREYSRHLEWVGTLEARIGKLSNQLRPRAAKKRKA